MSDSTSGQVSRVGATAVRAGEMGQRHLAAGSRVAMRLWAAEEPGEGKPEATRDYETVGYVITGRARLRAGDRTLELGPGDSWVVPAGVGHTYEIVETFTAVEATSPPAQEGGRDAPPS
ncbi:quercetin dioxygenase-like cupin family protein [Geodermatophilus bullaregiensis]|uniref:cupin domain-containing protein n=1 Tax=Geodermatophilus bullaregiensis TaxID=1564160 RepID=UPI0027DDD28E|nr:cupin domain-containing protein [Geodermatophilus bullaregiensis]MBM7808342.1 quercetin dioxygenase-like cupin family protein [Geodermatophilus bullaregiensis]